MIVLQLTEERWTVEPVGDLSDVPTALRGRQLSAAVPGCVHTDLIRAGLIGHPNEGFNEHLASWVGEADWRYRCAFDVDSAVVQEQRVDLVCTGLDTIAEVSLNDEIVGRAANMHHPHRFDCRHALRPGENTLIITFTSPVRHIEAQEEQLGKRPYNGDWGPYPYIRKAACNFGWDWGPKVPTVGLWRDIYVQGWSGVRLCSVRPLVRRAEGKDWRIAVCADLEWADRQSSGAGTVLSASLTADAGPVAEGSTPLEHGVLAAKLCLDVHDPKLWWPRDCGLQTLYTLDVALTDGEAPATGTGRHRDRWTARIGFRTVTLNTTSDDTGTPFTIEINEQPLFCKGANWIPDTLFPGEMTPERYRRRVEQAAGANMNMLRVWGGGFYEDRAFYEACDELGIMVWQDFMFACATYPEQEPYWSSVETEARHNITRLNPHPSVVLWCGGNECIWGHESWGYKQKLKKSQTWGRGYYLELLPRLVDELDPSTPYWPNSPYSGSEDIHPLDVSHGNRHTWDRTIQGYQEVVPRFVTEFGHQSPPNYATLSAALPGEALEVNCQALQHRQRAAGGNRKWYDKPLKEWFRPPGNFDEWHYLAQVLQARAVAMGIEWLCAHMPDCMGSLYWQLNDCWAGHSWSAIDCDGRRKPLWYATRRAYAPRLLTIQPSGGRPILVAVNDNLNTWNETVVARRLSFDGEELASHSIALNAGSHTALPLAELDKHLGKPADPASELLLASAGRLRTWWFYAKDRELDYPQPQFNAHLHNDGQGYVLRIDAHTLLRDIVVAVDRVDPHAEISDQLVTLLPGESHEFKIATAAELSPDVLTNTPVFCCANYRPEQ